MPTYEYRCRKCRRRFERFQPITAKPLARCPHCGARPERLIGSGGGLLFKGSGFYATDYKKPSGGKSEGGTGEKKGKGDGGGSKPGGLGPGGPKPEGPGPGGPGPGGPGPEGGKGKE